MSLSKFHFWCQKVLPLVYDDSLSYYEVLCKITTYLNNTIEAVNELSETVTQYDEQIADLNTKYTTLSSSVASLTSTVTSNYTELSGLVTDLTDRVENNEASITSINATITLLKSADEALQEAIDSLDTNLTTIINNNYETLDRKIDALQYSFENDSALAELRIAVKELQDKMNNLTYDVYNYALNSRVSFDRNNWALYEHLGNGLTAEQYCTLGLSADDYADYGMRAIDYIKFSRDWLHYDWAYVPVKGGRQSHSNALSYLANLIYQTMTASEYAGLDLDADGYANLDLTATQYLYYPIGDDVALKPLENIANLITRITDLQNRVSALEGA